MKMKPLNVKFPALAAAIAAALIAICPAQTRANTVALDFTGGTVAEILSGDATLGWAFSLSSAVLLTDLGLWDQSSDGLTNSYQVTIWTSAGVQVAQGTVPSGTSGTFVASSVDGFRYVSVAPTLLAAGNYTIGAYYVSPADAFIIGATTITTASGVTYNGSRSETGNAFPSGDLGEFSNSYFGPNFQFTTDLNGNAVSVPDAGSTFVLMFGSIAALLALGRILPQKSAEC